MHPVIYSIYIRNHTIEGTINAAKSDLKRIKNLGVDVVWLMPIHPIGNINKKGDLGCPYAVRNYREVNSEYGTKEDLQGFIDEVHHLGMKVIVDVVFNHTAKDHEWTQSHPDYYFKNSSGDFSTKVSEWTDVFDLDFNNKELKLELIETLLYWLNVGFDGFRCDVASLIPQSFWVECLLAFVKAEKLDVLMLAESIDPQFMTELRRNNYLALCDSELYPMFNYTYDYDTYKFAEAYLDDKVSFSILHEKVRQQQYILPQKGYKMRFVENHDTKRIEHLVGSDEDKKIMWIAWSYFQCGGTLLYGGVETENTYTPTLFDREPVEWTEKSNKYELFIKKINKLMKSINVDLMFYEVEPYERDGLFVAKYTSPTKIIYGIFNVDCQEKWLRLPSVIRYKSAKNLITGDKITLDKSVTLRDEPIIYEIKI